MKKWKIPTLLLLAGLSTGAQANGVVQGTVSKLIQRASDGLTYVVINGTSSGRPSCATGSYWIIAHEDSESGKKQFAMLMTAYATGSPVVLHGMGACNRWSDGEDIDEIFLQN